ncbi:hypothetical protein SESBI_50542 [Sesbania bispinosa]|nr:hypothetical protein SESBI_50542 [Sesbania bispinosa]
MVNSKECVLHKRDEIVRVFEVGFFGGTVDGDDAVMHPRSFVENSVFADFGHGRTEQRVSWTHSSLPVVSKESPVVILAAEENAVTLKECLPAEERCPG